MILVTAATEFEMNALMGHAGMLENRCQRLVTGVGLARTAQNVTRFLCESKCSIDAVLNFGVGGAYFQAEKTVNQPQLLDVCVAERELFGDLGVCMGNEIEYLSESLVGPIVFDLKNDLYNRCTQVLNRAEIPYRGGTFISVNSVTGLRARGDMLQRKWNGLCENMEGAAVAQVCSMFSLNFFELRCISNMVEDRNPVAWRLQEACEKVAITIKKIVEEIS
ncbi:MAG: futalosine hydrolase [Desulfotalea sp.]|nr:MAG: futalosine hydrolase [Desulfotalea sp.]